MHHLDGTSGDYHRHEACQALPIPIPHAYQDLVQTVIKYMLDLGITEPSSSERASPIVLVDKKDSTVSDSLSTTGGLTWSHSWMHTICRGLAFQTLKDPVHQSLKSCWCSLRAKGHHLELKQAKWCCEGCERPKRFGYWHLPTLL